MDAMNTKIQSLWDSLTGRAAPLWVVAACAFAYANALGGPFVFDDLPAIVLNEHLPPASFTECFAAPAGSTASGRPLVALSFALNHALFGTEVTGWHATNLILHILTALALLSLARETLKRRGHERGDAAAFAIALLWSVHPLLSDAINLIASRSELMVSLAYLCVLLCLTKSATDARPWSALCVLACLAGMVSKEVMVGAPLIAIAWDRSFLSGSWRAAWRERRGLHLSLASTWFVLAACVWASDRGESVSLGTTVVSAYESLCTQAGAIVHYLRLFFWPAALSIDYADWPVARDFTQILPQALALLVLGVLALCRFISRHADGLLLVIFFVILWPSSSLIPLTGELVAEHRMYLASAPLLALIVLAVQRYLPSGALIALTLLFTPTLLMLTRARNEEWSSARAIWESATVVRPANARAWNSLGVAQKIEGRLEEAARAWHEALLHDPDDYHAHGNLGKHYARENDAARSIHHFGLAVKAEPDDLGLRFELGSILLVTGDASGAEEHLSIVLRLASESWEFREKAERRLARARQQR